MGRREMEEAKAEDHGQRAWESCCHPPGGDPDDTDKPAKSGRQQKRWQRKQRWQQRKGQRQGPGDCGSSQRWCKAEGRAVALSESRLRLCSKTHTESTRIEALHQHEMLPAQVRGYEPSSESEGAASTSYCQRQDSTSRGGCGGSQTELHGGSGGGRRHYLHHRHLHPRCRNSRCCSRKYLGRA